MDTNKFTAPLVRAWNENPTQLLAVGAGVALATAKLIDAAGGVQSRRAYARATENRIARKNQKY